MRILAIRGCNLASLAGEFAVELEAPLLTAGWRAFGRRGSPLNQVTSRVLATRAEEWAKEATRLAQGVLDGHPQGR